MSQCLTQDTTILRQIYDPANRANPYPLWAELRQTPVCWQEDGPDEEGTYVVSTYREIEALLHRPTHQLRSEKPGAYRGTPADCPWTHMRLSTWTPRSTTACAGLTMRHFGPPERPAYLEQLRPEILRIVTTLLDQLQGQRQFDLVERFAYPLPVTVICRILGVPLEDEPQFHAWVEAISGKSGEAASNATPPAGTGASPT